MSRYIRKHDLWNIAQQSRLLPENALYHKYTRAELIHLIQTPKPLTSVPTAAVISESKPILPPSPPRPLPIPTITQILHSIPWRGTVHFPQFLVPCVWFRVKHMLLQVLRAHPPPRLEHSETQYLYQWARGKPFKFEYIPYTKGITLPEGCTLRDGELQFTLPDQMLQSQVVSTHKNHQFITCRKYFVPLQLSPGVQVRYYIAKYIAVKTK